MRDFAKISCAIWGSKKFSKLPDESKLLYLYFHTSPHCNSIGCYYIPKGYIKVDMNWKDRAIDRAIKGLSEGLIQWNKEEEIVKINNFLRHSPITNKKHAIGSVKIALSLPDCNEKSLLIKDLQEIPWCKDIKELADYDTTMIGLSEGYHTETETETETETKKNNIKKNPDLFDSDEKELNGKKKNDKPKTRRKQRIETRFPTDKEFPDCPEKYQQWAIKCKVTRWEPVWRKFFNSHFNKQNRYVSWYKAWQNWIDNHIEWGHNQSSNRPRPDNGGSRGAIVEGVNMAVLGSGDIEEEPF